MPEELSAQLAEQGYQGRMVSIEHLADLQDEFEVHLSRGLIDQELYQTYLAELSFNPPNRLPQARSMIVVAVPQPRIRITFSWDGEPVQGTIPPTYPEWEIDKRVRGFLRQVLEPAGYWLADALVPKKLLAVRSGLAEYGRNNITYVPGMGSFFGLATVYSDAPTHNDLWQETQAMERCDKCTACLHYCPASAITADRFLLHAERCISFHNEKPSAVHFPEWLDPSWHNCLVGCLHCQRVCPENKKAWKWVEGGAEFSQEETALLLEGLPFDRLPAATAQKLKRLNLDAYAEVLPRNLSALLRQRL